MKSIAKDCCHWSRTKVRGSKTLTVIVLTTNHADQTPSFTSRKVNVWICAPRGQPTVIFRASASFSVNAWTCAPRGQPTVLLRVSARVFSCECLDMSLSGNRPWSSDFLSTWKSECLDMCTSNNRPWPCQYPLFIQNCNACNACNACNFLRSRIVFDLF